MLAMSFTEDNVLSQDGMTLIELLMVLAIIAIVAAIAYPSYSDSVRKGRRADATGALLAIQLAQERYRGEHARYAPSLVALGWPHDPAFSTLGYYRLSIEVGDDPAADFLAQATPTDLGGQILDLCRRMVITSAGPDLAAGSDPRCWE